MKIAIISDIHDNAYNLVSFYRDIKEKDIEYILCLWDLMNNWIAKILAYSKIPVHMVWWNNDWDLVAITKTSFSEWSTLTVSATVFDNIVIDWKKIFMTHYPSLAKSIAKSWDYDVVLYGHDHNYNNINIWECLIVNPWELATHKTWKATYAIYDTVNNKAEIIDLEDILCTKNNKVDNYRKEMWFKYSNTKEYKL